MYAAIFSELQWCFVSFFQFSYPKLNTFCLITTKRINAIALNVEAFWKKKKKKICSAEIFSELPK